MSNFLRIVPAGDGPGEQLINLDNVDTVSEFQPSAGVYKLRVVFAGGNEQEFAGFTLQQFVDTVAQGANLGVAELKSESTE